MAIAQEEKIDNIENDKVKWTDRSAEEQREMIKANLAYQINRAVTNGTSVLFDKKAKMIF